MSDAVYLSFYHGTIDIRGDYAVPHAQWDERSHSMRACAHYYSDIITYLENSGINFRDTVLELIPCPDLVCSRELVLRGYQQEALERWMRERRGVVVLPTGSGKTMIAVKAIERVNAPVFIVVPTLDLVDQWREQLRVFDIEIGEYSGRVKNLQPLTVSTYDSAYTAAERLGNKFKMVVFDEVHHLPSEGYRHIAECFASPYRMGLTATYEREDGLHELLPRLLGGKVYEVEVDELAGEHLSPYRVVRINVELTPEERAEYETNMEVFRGYIQRADIKMRTASDFQKVVIRSGYDPRAWNAVKARNRARRVAYNSQAKMAELEDLLDKHRDDRIIIFTRYNDLVYRIAEQYFIPCITHKTDRHERVIAFQGFREGVYSAMVSSQVLDEGIDVPDANIGILMSGTGSNREYVQRLGRLLRPSEKNAVLYEIVSSGTSETSTAYRRKKKRT